MTNNKCYFQIPFNFTAESLKWIDDHVNQLSDYHNITTAINSITCRLNNFNDCMVAENLRSTLKVYNLTGTNFEMFTYKPFIKPNLDGGYPHLDYFNDTPVFARMNVLLVGKNDPMYWWPYNIESDYILKSNILTNGKKTRLKGYLIDNLSNLSRKDLYDKLGKFVDYTDNLYKTNHAAIVRTDCLHAVTWSGGERIVLSMQIKEPWNEIEKQLNILNK